MTRTTSWQSGACQPMKLEDFEITLRAPSDSFKLEPDVRLRKPCLCATVEKMSGRCLNAFMESSRATLIAACVSAKALTLSSHRRTPRLEACAPDRRVFLADVSVQAVWKRLDPGRTGSATEGGGHRHWGGCGLRSVVGLRKSEQLAQGQGLHDTSWTWAIPDGVAE